VRALETPRPRRGSPPGRRRGACQGLGTEERLKRYPRSYQPWTPDEDLLLERDWGAFNVGTICRRLGRTPSSVESRALALKLGPTGRGRKTVEQLALETGYSRTRIFSAAKALGLSLPRAARRATSGPTTRRRFALDVCHERALLELLATHPDGKSFTSRRVYETPESSWVGRPGGCCSSCSRADVPHKAHGKCMRCCSRDYSRERRARLAAEARAAAAS
jgi:hypothetical protein